MSRRDPDEWESAERGGYAIATMFLPKVAKHLRWARMNLNTVRHQSPVAAKGRKGRFLRFHSRLEKMVLELSQLERDVKDMRALSIHLLDESLAEMESKRKEEGE